MKYFNIAIVIFFSISSLKAQNEALHLLDSLPSNFSYRLDRDSIALLKFRKNEPPIKYTEDKMKIGCYQPVEVQPLFSLTIGHEFLFEGSGEYHLFINKKKTSQLKLILYAVKKESNEKDSSLMKALDEYCIYGQANYFFQSDEYIVFTYASINSSGIVRRFDKLGLWKLIENRLIDNLNAQAIFTAKTQLPAPISNPYHKKDIIRGKFVWSSGGLPNRTIKTKDQELHIIGSPATSHTYLNLKKNNRALKISNYSEPKSNHYRYKCRWFMDNQYIYLYNPSYGIETYRIHNENVLMHISEKYGFTRQQD